MDRYTPTRVYDNPNLGQVVGWMRKFAHQGREDPEVINFTQQLCRGLASGDYASEVAACYYGVCQHVRYVRDPEGVELVKTPRKILETGTGDCDDMSTLLAAMLMAVGNRCRFVLVGFRPGAPPSHVYTEAIGPQGMTYALDPVANKDIKKMLARVKTRQVVAL